MEIQHSSHEHPLIVFNKKNYEGNCSECRTSNGGPAYVCIPCKYVLHISCTETLPVKLQHPFHPGHSLTRSRYGYKFWCNSCYQKKKDFHFHCSDCKFNLCFNCALIPLEEVDGGEKIHHFSHVHPLTLSDLSDLEQKEEGEQVGKESTGPNKRRFCFACQKQCSGPAYCCILCEYFLHVSCAELPRETWNPFHPRHPLVLLARARKSNRPIRCHGCLKICGGFTFCCEMCNFDLDVECAFLMPTIKYDGHNHLLTFFENIYVEPNCNACNAACKSSTFRCVECDFHLHLLCGPLPCVIKHGCHIDPLTLIDYLVEDDYEEFTCDACETERDPRICVYYCADCKYIAHVNCVISEVIRSFKGELGEVELRTVGRGIAGKVISKGLVMKEMEQIEAEPDSKDISAEEVEIERPLTLKYILNSLNKEEYNEIEGIMATPQMIINRDDVTASEIQRDISKKVSPDSDEAFTQLMDRIDSHNFDSDVLVDVEALLPDLNEEELNYVAVGEYMVARSLVPVLEDLFAKYGDVSADSMLSPRAKTVFFFLLCMVVHSMRKTTVVDISENLLLTWWNHMKAVQRAGFKIQFAIDHLKTVTRAYFGIQAKKFADDTLAKQEKQIAQLSYRIMKLTTKLEAVKKKHEQHTTHVKSATTSFMEECLREASAMKWKMVAKDLL